MEQTFSPMGQKIQFSFQGQMLPSESVNYITPSNSRKNLLSSHPLSNSLHTEGERFKDQIIHSKSSVDVCSLPFETLESGLPGEKTQIYIEPIAFCESFIQQAGEIGSLTITNYRIRVKPKGKRYHRDYPLTSVCTLTKTDSINLNQKILSIETRDIRHLVLIFDKQEDEVKSVCDYITIHGIAPAVESVFAFNVTGRSMYISTTLTTVFIFGISFVILSEKRERSTNGDITTP